jgi:excisionase family DNA binding protein
MTVKEAAERLEISLGLMYSLCRAGVIRHIRVGMPGKRGSIRICEEAIAGYRQAREVGPALPKPASRAQPKLTLHHLQLPS